jgi:hypothetical protein
MCLLVGVVERDQLGPPAARPEQLAAQQLDALPGLERPGRIGLVGQQLARAQCQGRLRGRAVPGERRARRGVERDEIHGYVAARKQRDHLVP